MRTFFPLVILLLLFACSSTATLKPSKPEKTTAKVVQKKVVAKKKKTSKLQKVRIYILPINQIEISDYALHQYTDADVSDKQALQAFLNGIEYYQYKDNAMELVIQPIKANNLALKTRKTSDQLITTFEPINLQTFCDENNIVVDPNAFLLCMGKLQIKESTESLKKTDFIDSNLDYLLLNTESGDVLNLGHSNTSITYPTYRIHELKALGKKTLTQIIETILYVE
jgi:hypothetical protein